MITTTEYEKSEIVRHIRELRAKRVVEIGAFRGETTRVIADAVAEQGGKVIVIDPMTWATEVVRNGIARHLSASFPRAVAALEWLLDRASYEPAFWRNVGGKGRENVVLHRVLSTDRALLAKDDEDLTLFDLLFVDGDHGFDGALGDLERWGRRVRKGGVVLVHDATPRFPGVLRAIRRWSDDPRIAVEWPTKHSLCVVRVLEDLRVPLGATSRPHENGHNGASHEALPTSRVRP